MRLPILLAVVLLAGCANNDPAPADPSAPVTTPAQDPVTTSIPVSLPVATPTGEPAASEQGTFDVPEGANETLVEARWTCTSPTCGFALVVLDDAGGEEGSDSGQGSATVTETLSPGSYTAAMFSTGPAVNMEGEIRVTTFFGPVPDGFSAFEA